MHSPPRRVRCSGTCARMSVLDLRVSGRPLRMLWEPVTERARTVHARMGLLAFTRFVMTSGRIVIGGLSYWTSIVIIVQAETNIDLFSNFAALQVSCALCARANAGDAQDARTSAFVCLCAGREVRLVARQCAHSDQRQNHETGDCIAGQPLVLSSCHSLLWQYES